MRRLTRSMKDAKPHPVIMPLWFRRDFIPITEEEQEADAWTKILLLLIDIQIEHKDHDIELREQADA
ncbi:hypothetical protein LCGC14_1735290 [marine sediment metagenome]|uniref:Uncharacterized protein n=1 Tax=marine sediment metagenome TaxID=412755 RepID=A0A0F9H870_9ZZZZ